MKKLEILFLCVSICLGINSQTLKIGTYNIRQQNESDVKTGNGWQRRCPVICDLLNFENPDLLGCEEVFVGQLHDLLNGLDGYAYIGVGRDDGKEAGEFSPILYKTSKFKLLKSGHFWLAPDPTKPALGWDAACIRICTWGYFQDKQTKFRFWYFNLHMDHIGVTARRESAKLVISKIKSICGKDPVILSGDFNVDQHNEIYSILSNSGILKDSYSNAEHRFAETGTFNNFQSNTKTDSRIDHIFVSPSFTVERYGILTDCYWTLEPKSTTSSTGIDENNSVYVRRTPSDHYPVFVQITVR